MQTRHSPSKFNRSRIQSENSSNENEMQGQKEEKDEHDRVIVIRERWPTSTLKGAILFTKFTRKHSITGKSLDKISTHSFIDLLCYLYFLRSSVVVAGLTRSLLVATVISVSVLTKSKDSEKFIIQRI